MKEEYYMEISRPSNTSTHTYGPYDNIGDAKLIARNMLAEEVKRDNLCEITISGKITNEVFRVKLPRELTFSTLSDAQNAANDIAIFIGKILGYSSAGCAIFYEKCFSVESDTEEVDLKKIHYTYNRTQDE